MTAPPLPPPAGLSSYHQTVYDNEPAILAVAGPVLHQGVVDALVHGDSTWQQPAIVDEALIQHKHTVWPAFPHETKKDKTSN